MYDEACVLYNTQGQDFAELFNNIVNSPNGEQKYFFGGPDYLLLALVKEDEDGMFWHICYAAHRNPEYLSSKRGIGPDCGILPPPAEEFD